MSRPSVFEDDIPLDQFLPKSGPTATEVSSATIKRIADASGFPSRAPGPTRREPLTYRSGRDASFSVKTMPATVEAFYAIARSRGWKAGETFEKAIEALQEKLGS